MEQRSFRRLALRVLRVAGIIALPGFVFAGWVWQPSGTDVTLYSVHFPVDDQTGYAVGWSSTILKTTNGGADWISQSSGSGFFYSVQFLDNSTGYVAGETLDHNVILKTTSGGAVWAYDTVPWIISPGYLRSVCFPTSGLAGYIAADMSIYKTVDGGASWSIVYWDTTTSLAAIDFPVDAQTGYAVGFGGTILKTNDGAASWFGQNSGTENMLFGVHFPADNQTGYAVGERGTILKTVDGGAHWVSQPFDTTAMFQSVYFPVDAETGYAVGDRIVKTTNGGGNWHVQESGGSNLYSVHFPVDARTGYAVGSGGLILKTTDGGAGTKEERGPDPGTRSAGSRAIPNPFTASARIPGRETEYFEVYDISGNRVTECCGGRFGEKLLPGIYFLQSSGGHANCLRVVKAAGP